MSRGKNKKSGGDLKMGPNPKLELLTDISAA